MAYNNPLQVYEIFDNVEKQKTKAEKVKVLKNNDIWPIKDILRAIYDDAIQFLLPEGKPPYTPCKPESAPSSLLRANKQYKYFVKGGPGQGLPAVKREKMFIDILESVHPEEALILIDMINKKSIKGITKATVKEAYPDLIKE